MNHYIFKMKYSRWDYWWRKIQVFPLEYCWHGRVYWQWLLRNWHDHRYRFGIAQNYWIRWCHCSYCILASALLHFRSHGTPLWVSRIMKLNLKKDLGFLGIMYFKPHIFMLVLSCKHLVYKNFQKFLNLFLINTFIFDLIIFFF